MFIGLCSDRCPIACHRMADQGSSTRLPRGGAVCHEAQCPATFSRSAASPAAATRARRVCRPPRRCSGSRRRRPPRPRRRRPRQRAPLAYDKPVPTTTSTTRWSVIWRRASRRRGIAVAGLRRPRGPRPPGDPVDGYCTSPRWAACACSSTRTGCRRGFHSAGGVSRGAGRSGRRGSRSGGTPRRTLLRAAHPRRAPVSLRRAYRRARARGAGR